MAAIHPREPETYTALAPVLPVLAPLFNAWNDLPATLSHGDFHPLNIIWQGHAIGAVVDWEFAGIRPTFFDAANTLGCVGIEDPYALVKGLAPAMLTVLRDEECLDAASLTLLPQMILGLRFAWMSEWLRKQDREMIEMEVRYMRLLANSLDSLLPAWEKGLGISPTVDDSENKKAPPSIRKAGLLNCVILVFEIAGKRGDFLSNDTCGFSRNHPGYFIADMIFQLLDTRLKVCDLVLQLSHGSGRGSLRTSASS